MQDRYHDNKNIENAVDRYLDMVDFTLTPLFDMQNHDINIMDYLAFFDKNNICIGGACGHFNELLIIANLNKEAELVINNKEDLELLQDIMSNVDIAYLSYSLFSDGVYKDNAKTWFNILSDVSNANIDSFKIF